MGLPARTGYAFRLPGVRVIRRQIAFSIYYTNSGQLEVECPYLIIIGHGALLQMFWFCFHGRLHVSMFDQVLVLICLVFLVHIDKAQLHMFLFNIFYAVISLHVDTCMLVCGMHTYVIPIYAHARAYYAYVYVYSIHKQLYIYVQLCTQYIRHYTLHVQLAVPHVFYSLYNFPSKDVTWVHLPPSITKVLVQQCMHLHQY